MQKTATIQIGNTDNKLTQQEWSQFVEEMNKDISMLEIHFSGFSLPDKPWQNACWVFCASEVIIDTLRKTILPSLCKEFKHESIALTVGDTEFVS